MAIDMAKYLNPVSYLSFSVAIIAGIRSEIQAGADVSFLLAGLFILLFIFITTMYGGLIKGGDLSLARSDLAVLFRATVSACYTVHLFTRNDIFTEAWNYMPLVLMITLSIIYLMQSDSECDRGFLTFWLIVNLVGQLYAAFKIESMYVGTAAIMLGAAQTIFENECFLNMPTHIWFNFLTSGFCLLADGNLPFNKGGD